MRISEREREEQEYRASAIRRLVERELAEEREVANRAKKSEATFGDASDLASRSGMSLTNPSDGCYQLRHNAKGWILNLYPRRSGLSPRAYHDPSHRGPFLTLPQNWTLLEAVQSAAVTWCGIVESEGSR